MENMFSVLKKEAPQNYKPFLLQKLQKSVIKTFNCPNPEIQNFIQKEYKVWQLLYQNLSYQEAKEKFPNGSAYLILQLDHNNEHLYIGIIRVNRSTEHQSITAVKVQLPEESNEAN